MMKFILTIALLIGLNIGSDAQSVKAPIKAALKGIASFYHAKFNGRKTATGEVFANTNYTAASNQIGLNTYVKVTNLRNGRVVYVKINDRMAANSKRMLDLTEVAADKLDYRSAGTTQVKIETVSKAEGLSGILAQRESGAGKKNTL